MLPRIRKVSHLGDYRLHLEFSDGVGGDIDLSDMLVDAKGMVAELKDLQFFKRVSVDSEVGALVWPNGVDFCPDVLYQQLTGRTIAPDQSAA